MAGPTKRQGVLDAFRAANISTGLRLGRGGRRLTALVTPDTLSPPTRLLIAPQDLRSSDATIALDIFAGHLTFAGRRIDTGGRSPFDISPPSQAFADELHGFSWLRHVRATDGEEARRSARSMVDTWIGLYGRLKTGTPFRPLVLARRIISWITQSPLLLEGAEETFYRAFIKSLFRQAAILSKERRIGVDAMETLPTLLALSYYALATDRNERFAATTIEQLIGGLRSEILPDGGHISRNPQMVIDLLLDLLPLQQAFAARSLKLPPDIPVAIGRMIEMLRLLRHADGALAQFNGMGLTEASQLATLLAYGGQNRASPDASYSGYQRLQGHQAVLLMEAGRVPPSRWSTAAHAGCLSIEFSARGSRILVNCGAPRAGEDIARHLARSTAAHSTLVLADTSSCRFIGASSGPLARRIWQGPKSVTYGREESEDGEMLIARHDGYEGPFGLIHQRSVWLAGNGHRIEGQDTILQGKAVKRGLKAQIAAHLSFAIRFHLHPSVRATLSADRHSVRLQAGSLTVWRFEANGAALLIEDSIFFATNQGRQRALQIVITGEAHAGVKLDWSLTLVE